MKTMEVQRTNDFLYSHADAKLIITIKMKMDSVNKFK